MSDATPSVSTVFIKRLGKAKVFIKLFKKGDEYTLMCSSSWYRGKGLEWGWNTWMKKEYKYRKSAWKNYNRMVALFHDKANYSLYDTIEENFPAAPKQLTLL